MLGLRQPRTLLATVAMAAVLAAVAATPALFLSSVSSAAVQRQIAPSCRGSAIDPGADAALGRAQIDAARATTEGFAPQIDTALMGSTGVRELQARLGERSALVQLGTRTGFAERLPGLVPAAGSSPASSGTATGIWLPDTVAGPLGATAGDTVTIVDGDASTDLPVVAVYRDLTSGPFDAFWCQLQVRLGATTYLAVGGTPPPLAMVDPATLAAVSEQLGRTVEIGRVEVPFEELPRTLTAARRDVDRLDTLSSAVGPVAARRGETKLARQSRLAFMTARAAAIRRSVGAAVTPMAVVSALVALGLLGGVASTWARRRRVEVRLLAVRGAAPAAIGIKAVLEVAVGLVAGTVIGWLLAWVLVTRLGPADDLDPGALVRAAWFAAAGLALAVVTVWTVATRQSRLARPAIGPHPWRSMASRIPWELAALALAWWSLARLRAGGIPQVQGANLPKVDALALAFPLLFLLGGMALVARLLRAALGASRRIGDGLPVPLYLTLRRLAAERGPVLLLAGLSGLAIGVVVYGAGLVSSTAATITAKTGVDLGARVVAGTIGVVDVPPALRGRASPVGAGAQAEYGDTRVDVLAVDPATFADAAFWDPSFADRPLHELLAELDTIRADGRIPAIASGGAIPESATLSARQFPRDGAEVVVVGRARVLPTADGSVPLLVVPADSLGAMGTHLESQLWADATATEVRTALTDLGERTRYLTAGEAVVDTAPYLPTIWTFGLVRALGVLVAVLGLGTLLVYLDARQRSRVVPDALARRMGLTARGSWLGLILELGALAVVAVTAGVTLGWIAVRLVNRELDPVPDVLPPALLRFPAVAVAAVVVAAVAAVVIGATVVERTVSTVEVGEVLRGDD